MKTMKASDFKARCLAVMDEVAELRAHAGRRVKSPIGLHRGQVRIIGDILAPLGVKWEGFERSCSYSLHALRPGDRVNRREGPLVWLAGMLLPNFAKVPKIDP